ncbi:Alpha-L-iduronidase [Blattella germanica]|nr:Alpha-L-iduronidase [Blattella germanica]
MLKISFIIWSYCNIHLVVGPQVVMDFTKSPVGELKRFWDSTGFCPPLPRSSTARFMLSPDVLFNLALIGSIPNKAISQVRIHWLLDIITVSINESGVPHYNFTSLDQLLDWMHFFNLNPGFEIMGNPSEYFSNFSDNRQVLKWRQMIQQIASRYIDRYGLPIISRWRFETWNEPDLKSYNIFNFTFQRGPAGLFKAPEKHPLCWGLLEYCSNSTTCPLDFISFHKKGGGSSKAILEQDLELALNISRRYPTLQGISLVNDEADPLTGWSKAEPWRADVRYAAMVASVIISHQQVMVGKYGLPLELLSNDNAFLNYHPFYFNQRTLLARFQMNNTNPSHIQFFKKPVYTMMSLLSLLGTQELNVTILDPDSRFQSLASTEYIYGAWSNTVLLVFSNDTIAGPDDILSVTLKMLNLRKIYRYVLYLMDNSVTNPENVWVKAGSPVFPTKEQRAQIRASEGPYRARGPKNVPHTGKLRLKMSLKLPKVAQVSRVMVCNITYNEVMLFWSDVLVLTRCMKTYEVEFRPLNRTEFKRINIDDTILLSFQYSVTAEEEQVTGWYRVRAVDYWNRRGRYSTPVKYHGEKCS